MYIFIQYVKETYIYYITASPTELIYQYFSQLLPVYDNTSVVVSYEFTVT